MAEPSQKELDLHKQLTKALDGPLLTIFEDGLTADVETFPALADVVRRVAGDRWDDHPNAALKDVIREAAKLIVNKVPTFAGMPSLVDLRQLATILCGLATDLPKRPGGGRYAYKELRAIAIERTGFRNISESTYQRKIATPVKQALADVLINRQGEVRAVFDKASTREKTLAGQAKDSSDQMSNKVEEYIPRRALENNFRAAVAGGAKLIAFLGLPGMGKTSLADMLTVADRPQQCAWIVAKNGEPNSLDVAALLTRFAIDLSAFPNFGPAQQLVAALASDKAPPMIVLDNLESLDEVKRLLPSDTTNSTIVVTARRRGTAKFPSIRIIEVGPLSEDEAVLAIRRRVPALDDLAAKEVAEWLGYYPLVISFVCVLMANHGLKPKSLRTFNSQNLPKLISLDGGGTLLAALERIIVELESRDPSAFRVLLFVLYMRDGSVSDTAWREIEYYLCVDQLQRAHCFQALEEFMLLTRKEITAGSIWRGKEWAPYTFTSFALHPLVNSVLRSLLIHRVGELLERCISLVANYRLVNPTTLGDYDALCSIAVDVAELLLCKHASKDSDALSWWRDLVGNGSTLAQSDPRIFSLLRYFANRTSPNLNHPFAITGSWVIATIDNKKVTPVEGLDLPWRVLEQYLNDEADEADLDIHFEQYRPFRMQLHSPG